MKKKRQQMMITDMPIDVLKHIMVFVAKSLDGAANLARAISVCKLFLKLSEDRVVLKAADFDHVNVLDRYKLFQKNNGLLTKCARVGNASAGYMLAKLILVSSSQLFAEAKVFALLDSSSKFKLPMNQGFCGNVFEFDSLASSFMTHFIPNQAFSDRSLEESILHYEFVRLFLCRCSPHDLSIMHPHLNDYLEYYIKSLNHGVFIDCINKMHHAYANLKDLEELKNLKNRVDGKVRIIRALQREIPENNEDEESDVLEEACYEVGFLCMAVEMKCRGKGLDDKLVLQGDFKELNEVMRAEVEKFEEFRAQAISLFDDYFPFALHL